MPQFVKFETAQEVEAYRVLLQQHHDDTHVQGTPRIIDLAFPTWDGKFAFRLHDDTWPETTGEIVDDVEPPVVEIDI